jgi:membrane fusion protein, multidrug efflux system
MRRARTGALLVVLAAACKDAPPPRAANVPVQVAIAVKVAAPVVVSANGVVEPLQSVALEAQVGGTLTEVAFREGDEVQQGQLLFRIDPRPYEAAVRQAEATLARDQAQATNAARDAERYKALVEKDYVTKAQADQADATAAAQRATVEADRAALDNAHLELGYTTIRAPIAGRTGSLLVRQGNLVKPNAGALVVINQIRPILVRFPIGQRDFPGLKRRAATRPLPVRVAGSDGTPIADAGTLSFLDNAVDSLTGTVTAKARFANGGNALWPGEFVRVSVQLDVQNDAVAVPARAILAGQDGSYVFVIDSAHVARMRTITAGRAVGDLIVVEQGLVAGEQVVVDGQSRLTPGAKVDVKESEPVTASRTSR